MVFILQKVCDVHMTSGGPYGQGKGFQVGEESLSRGRLQRGRLDVTGAVGIKGEESRLKSLFSS